MKSPTRNLVLTMYVNREEKRKAYLKKEMEALGYVVELTKAV